MATETMNGAYSLPNGQGYDVTQNNFESQAANHTLSTTTDYGSSTATTAAKADVPKDEIGWYFVEQYYTTLSKTPEKLFLFYNKQSQFVSGAEAEKVGVCVGQKAINERITQLDFQDCKVRVTNVDSQGSRSSIIIQVIGEISNKAQPTRKFTQTFVLAEQTNGYFVLNDIFRYIIEDEEYEPAEEGAVSQPVGKAAETAPEKAPTTEQSAAHNVTSTPPDAGLVARSLEAVEKKDGLAEPTVNGHDPVAAADAVEPAAEPAADLAAPAEIIAAETGMNVEPITVSAKGIEESILAEKPPAPEPTPATLSPKPAPAQTTAPVPAPAPAKPTGSKSWATVAGGSQAARVTPAIPTVPTPSAPAAAKAAPPTAPAAQTPSFPTGPAAFTASAAESDRAGTPNSSSEWQTAGHEHNRRQSRPQGAQPASAENSRAYIRGVTENIDEGALRLAIGASAQPKYVDINRGKSCAFVDFDSPADYRAAVAGNPYEVAGVSLYIEDRKFRPTNGQGSYNNRGNVRGRGGFAPGQGQGRGGMPKDGTPRGNYTGGRGRGNYRGGRGGSVSQPTV